MKKKTVFWGVLAAFLLIFIVAVIVLMPKIKAYIPYYKDLKGIDQQDLSYTLTIEKSDFENEVAKRLAENDIIVSSVRFLNYIHKNYPDFVWYNGIYEVNAKMSYKELCKALMEPDASLNYVKVVIPEGKTVREIAEIFDKSGLCKDYEFLTAADSYDYDFAFLEELKMRDQSLVGYKLEGFLFPATYEFRADTVTAREIVSRMLQAFDDYVSDDMIKAANEMDLSLNEFITLASVVQAEAFSSESMTGVAGVFWNRLNSSDMRLLQSDPTTEYAGELSVLSHYSSAMEKAYDTYKCIGLPVGPTNCPGVDSMKAVLDPEESNYYYFVTDKNQKFYFNETLSGHNKTIKSLVNQGLWA